MDANSEDIKCLFERAMEAGHCRLTGDRFTGVSSNAIFRLAYGGEPPGKREMPYDQSDYDACVRTVEKLPEHRRTPQVMEALERARQALESRP